MSDMIFTASSVHVEHKLIIALDKYGELVFTIELLVVHRSTD